MYSDETIEAMIQAYWSAKGMHITSWDRMKDAVEALEATVEQKALRRAEPHTHKDAWDFSIHTNPSAQVWAAAFARMYPTCNVPEDAMLGWFANAMMAMHDFLKGGEPINGDHAQFLLDEAARAGK